VILKELLERIIGNLKSPYPLMFYELFINIMGRCIGYHISKLKEERC